MHWGITHATAMVWEQILTFRWHKATSSVCYTVNWHPEEYAYPSQSLVFSHFHSLICSYVSGRRSDIDNAVRDYCQTIYPELEYQPTSLRWRTVEGTMPLRVTPYLVVKMLSNWKTIPVILAYPPLEFWFLLLFSLLQLLDWSNVPVGDNAQQNMVNMFHVTLQFPHCQSVQLLYLSYCSARLTAHDRSSSWLAADMCDYTNAHANTCIYCMQVRPTDTCSNCIWAHTLQKLHLNKGCKKMYFLAVLHVFFFRIPCQK